MRGGKRPGLLPVSPEPPWGQLFLQALWVLKEIVSEDPWGTARKGLLFFFTSFLWAMLFRLR